MKKASLVVLSVVFVVALIVIIVASQRVTSVPAALPKDGERLQEDQSVDPSRQEGLNSPVLAGGKVQAACKLVPFQSARLGFNTSGLVASISVKEGQQVAAGTVLASLDGQRQAEADLVAADRELVDAEQALQTLNDEVYLTVARALKRLRDARVAEKEARTQLNRVKDAKRSSEEIEQAEAALGLARAEAQQADEVYQQSKFGPLPDAKTAAELRLKDAQARQAAAREVLEARQLTAPFSGTVIQVNMQPGEFAAAGVPVFLLADLDQFYVETTDLNELNILNVQAGEKVEIKFDALPQNSFDGVVESIQPMGKSNLGEIIYTVRIQGNFGDQGLLWGMTCIASIGE
jgi:multidrug resistance efflux pump